MDDRIVLFLGTDDAKLSEGVRLHADYIANETLVKKWATEPLDDPAYSIDVKIEGTVVQLHLQKYTDG